MNTKRILGLGLLVALSACQGQCSCGTTDNEDGVGGSGAGGSDTTTVTVTGSTTGSGGNGTGGNGNGGETSTGGGGTGGSEPIVNPLIRLAHLSGNAADVNICLVDSVGDAGEPLLGAEGITFKSYTDFAEIVPGTYSVRVISPDGACDEPDAPEFTGIEFAEGGVYTVAAIGDVDAGGATEFTIANYDETNLAFPEPGNVTVRLVHVATGGPAIDVGEYVADQFVPYWTNVSYPEDAGGVEIPSFATATLVARPTGQEVDAFSTDIEGPDGAIVSGFALGNATDGFEVFTITDFPAN